MQFETRCKMRDNNGKWGKWGTWMDADSDIGLHLTPFFERYFIGVPNAIMGSHGDTWKEQYRIKKVK